MKAPHERAKIDRLKKTLRSFTDAGVKEGCSFINDRMPTKQRRLMISLIKQAKKIDENQL